MARKTLRKIAGLLEAARVTTPGLVPGLQLVSDGKDKGLKFGGRITIGADSYDVAADNGKLKSYGTADLFVKDVAKYLPSNDGIYTVAVETGLMLVGSIPNDLKKDAAAKVVRYNTVKTAQVAVGVALDGELALMAGWDNGNALQKAKFAEVTAQRTAVTEDVAALDALIAHYTAIAA